MLFHGTVLIILCFCLYVYPFHGPFLILLHLSEMDRYYERDSDQCTRDRHYKKRIL